MKAIGIIKEIDSNFTEIEVFGDEVPCASCTTGSCASHAASGKTKTYQAVNSLNLELKAGIPVEIELPAGKAAAAFIRVIVVPLVLLFTCYFAAGFTAPASAGLRIAAGFFGLLAGFAANFLLSGKMKKREMPVITKILFAGR